MKKTWEWIKENSIALQGLAAITVILGAAVAIPSVISHVFRPDLVIRVNVDNSTLEPDLIKLIKDISHVFIYDADDFADIRTQNTRLAEIIDNPSLHRLSDPSIHFDKSRIEIINQSESVISGVRVRLDNVYGLWGAYLSGTFLEKAEIDRFQTALTNGVIVDDGKSDRSIVFPELPPIPPNSSIELNVYGGLDISKTTITAAGHSHSIIEIVEVEGGIVVWMYKNPILLFIFLPPVMLIAYALIIGALAKMQRRFIRKEEKNIFYNKACDLAIRGNADESITLLKMAIESGYSNRLHALKDEDLESLRERQDFNEMFKTP